MSRRHPRTTLALLGCLALVGACGSGDDQADEVGTSAGSSAPSSVAIEPIDVGVAETTPPDPAAWLVDDSGAVTPGDQVLVFVTEGAGRDTAESVAAALTGEVVGQIDLADLWQIRIPATDQAGLDAAIATAQAVDGVELAFPNDTATTDEEIWGVPISPLDDPVYAGATGDGYRMIGTEQAWTYLRGSGLVQHPVHVGVTDTGVWKGTGEFDGDVTIRETSPGSGVLTDPNSVRVKQADGTWVDAGANPGGGHGTGVTSIIGADADNGGTTGIASPLDQLTITTTNVFSPPYGNVSTFDQVPTNAQDDAQIAFPNGLSYTNGAFQAIAQQVRDGAQVINMSWGCAKRPCHPGTVKAYELFFRKLAARHPKVLFVAAAGNDGTAPPSDWPAGFALDNMITVGNLMNDGTTAASSNRSSGTFEVTLAAPGQQAVTGVDAGGTIMDDTYDYPGGVRKGGGTSMAAPQVTAAAALLKSIDPELTAAEIKELLVRTARTSITRPDGADQAIDAGVGGRVLAIDLAVFELVKQRRAELGLAPAELTPEQLAQLGSIDSVAVSTDDALTWDVRGIVAACDPPCTGVSIDVSADGVAIGGDTTQTLDAPGETTWSVTVGDYPATIVVRRADNGAGSRITLGPSVEGTWLGTADLVHTLFNLDPDEQGSDTLVCNYSGQAELSIDGGQWSIVYSGENWHSVDGAVFVCGGGEGGAIIASGTYTLDPLTFVPDAETACDLDQLNFDGATLSGVSYAYCGDSDVYSFSVPIG